MSDMLRGGAIGCGFWAYNHLNGWNEVEGGGIVAICDSNEGRLHAAGEHFGFAPEARYTDAAKMIAEQDLNFIDVITSVSAHRPLTELGAKNGLHVICQKPMSATMEDSRAMVEACKAAGVTFMIHENFRWQPAMVRMKELLPEIGEIYFGRVVWRSGYDVYRDQPYLKEDDEFITADLAIHLLDLARFFLGDADSVYSILQTVNPTIKGEDVGTYTLKMESGATCVVEASYASQPEREPFPQTYILLEGHNGTIRLDHDYHLTFIQGDKVQKEHVTAQVYPWSTAPFEAIQQSVVNIEQHWIDCLRNGTRPDTAGDDNIKSVELVFGAYESARTNLPYKMGTL